MTLTEANAIWEACYADPEGKGWSLYTSAQRLQAIEVRSGDSQPSYDPELARLEQRQWERDGWNLARASRQRF
ncbi:MAG: hypothetical protein ACO388_07485 [Saprospiraceae bacterium]